ncbi:MAG: DNA polymerase III subunit beta [Candidatus Omnitrophica bacterium]|nr:DNA polymerase III subunit beta [Candidatus Omnitrophota bacterium]
MKIKINKDVLIEGIQKVQGVITSKTTLPILSNVLIETQQDNLRLISTDLDLGITCVIPAEIQEPGAITVPAKRFSEIIKELPQDNITINTKKNNLVIIDTEVCQFKITGLPKEEFPKLPEFKDKQIIKLEQRELKEMIALTSFAVSFDETRYILNGILFQINQDKLTLVGTDGKRLALIERLLPESTQRDIRIIVPIKTIQELNRNLKEEGSLSLVLSGNQVMFELDGVVIVSRLIEGEFPDYKQVIPPPVENKLRLKREDFLWACRRAALLSTPDYQAVKLELFKNKLVLSKSTPDIGESREELRVEYSGKEMVIGFNPTYLIDVLKNLTDETIEFELNESEKPGIIRRPGYIYIVLPMRLG